MGSPEKNAVDDSRSQNKEKYETPELNPYGDVSTIARPESSAQLDVSVEELVEALNDESKAEELLRRKGWEKKDLIARAEQLTQELANQSKAISVV